VSSRMIRSKSSRTIYSGRDCLLWINEAKAKKIKKDCCQRRK
jgi:hypothetical protein